MASKHTPGPWTYYVWDLLDATIAGCPSSVSSHEPGEPTEAIVDIVDFSVEHRILPRDEQLANARLIAAAPELLAACKATLDAHEDSTVLLHPPIPWAQLRAAIATAEGVNDD